MNCTADYRICAHIDKAAIPNASTWLSEARFGFKHVSKAIADLSGSARILEIGCGSGILLSMLAETFPQHTFRGIEPFGAAFSHFETLTEVARQTGVVVETGGYEAFAPIAQYDLIYCVNVFEHVEDWRHLLDWASQSLKEGGVFIVLCPNYGFPYESHFRIPVIVNKRMTNKLFGRKIRQVEVSEDLVGLWGTLNFVTKRQVTRYIRDYRDALGLTMHDDLAIIDDMVGRLKNDPEIQKRQSCLGAFALGMQRVGVFGLLKRLPNFLPYMKLTFKRGAI